MSLGPIRELSTGSKPGGVSTFTKTQNEQKKQERKIEAWGGGINIKKGSNVFRSWALGQHLSRAGLH